MSYEKAMHHFRNHRKDRFTQECGGPRPNVFAEESAPVPYVDALTTLDRMDECRRECRIKGRTDTDFALRKACSIIAKAAGYVDRVSWLDALSSTETEEIPHEEGKAVALKVIREIEAWRKKHQEDSGIGIDYALRYAEAVVASNAGYSDRNTWTEALKQKPLSIYTQDYTNPGYPAWVW